MIYYVYRVTNVTNGKYYLGKHAAEQFDVSYLGSGKLIKQAVKKYGKNNFIVEMIKDFNIETMAYEYERLIVSEVLGDRNCYNLVDGGKGFSAKSAKDASNKSHDAGWYGFKSMSKDMLQRIAKSGGINGSQACKRLGAGMYAMTPEQRSVWSTENNKDRQWVTNGSIDLRIKLTEDMPNGYYIGRSNLDMSSRNNFLCWTDGIINKFAYESPGPTFYNGMIKETPTAKLPWWNNGAINKRAIGSPGPDFLPGRLEWTAKTVTCPHCNKSGGETGMKRHHFNHCKQIKI